MSATTRAMASLVSFALNQLWVWLLVPVPLIAYIQVAPKYLLPALPAAAILAAHGLDRFASRTAILAGWEAMLGEKITENDVEPLTWGLAEIGRATGAVRAERRRSMGNKGR